MGSPLSDEPDIGSAQGNATDASTQSADTSGQTIIDENDSGGSTGTGAFGLDQRASLNTLGLPIDGVQLGDYELVNVYPNLSFQEALLVDNVPGENRMIVVEQYGNIIVFNDDPAAVYQFGNSRLFGSNCHNQW